MAQPSPILDQAPDEASAAGPSAYPAPTQYVPILPGDDLAAVAARWNTSVEAIVYNNNLNPDFYLAWQYVWV